MSLERNAPREERAAAEGQRASAVRSGFGRALLGGVLLGCAALTLKLAVDQAWFPAAVTAAGAIYFALRFTGRLGPREPR